jgi:UDP-glucose 4-epimerase
LGWVPQHDDLDGIIQSALDWEKHLMRKNSH